MTSATPYHRPDACPPGMDLLSFWLFMDIRGSRRDCITCLPWYVLRWLGVAGVVVMAVCNLSFVLWPWWVPFLPFVAALVAWVAEWVCRSVGAVMPFASWTEPGGYAVFPSMPLLAMTPVPVLWAACLGGMTRVWVVVWAVLYLLWAMACDVEWQGGYRYP